MDDIPIKAVLEHFGTKGMKWGVRRQEKKAIKADFRKSLYSETKKELLKRKPAMDALENQAMDLAKHHTFDHDDGGGGPTAKDRAAGAKYMSLSDKHHQHELDAEDAARATVVNHMLSIHGKQKLTDLGLKKYTRNGPGPMATAFAVETARQRAELTAKKQTN